VAGQADPSYLALARGGELRRRADRLESMLHDCTVCPRACHVDRRSELGACMTGTEPIVASWTPHFGEEPMISGRRGSGTVFLGSCNLRCVFCQNHDISQSPRRMLHCTETIQGLAAAFLELQRRGCHNINWVSPSHQVPQLTRALAVAADQGLSIPIVYNSNGYDSVEVLALLDGVVDIYMPDLKYADAATGNELSGVSDYPRQARLALKEMLRQVGDRWRLDPDGVLRRGMLIRILVLPNDLADVTNSLRWIATELSPRVGISLMAQYYPTNLATSGRFPLLERGISAGEWARALEALERFMEGDHHYVQDHRGAAEYYRPDFSDRVVPFKDIADFEVPDRDDDDPDAG
jgi:putative pyruvate formate lyase activating enzyme